MIKNPGEAPTSSVEPLKADVTELLGNKGLESYAFSDGLVKNWVGELANKTQEAIDEASEKGRGVAVGMQFADGLTTYEDDALFMDLYFRTLGVKHPFEDRHLRSSDLLNAPELTKLLPHESYDENMDRFIKDPCVLFRDGRNEMMVLNTNSKSIKLLLEGPAVRGGNRVRPLLMVEMP